MTQTTPSKQIGWQTALERFEAEGGVLDLALIPESGGAGREKARSDGEGGATEAARHGSWQGRLLKLEGTSLIVEAPDRLSASGGEKRVPAQRTVQILLRQGDRRWSLRCRVLERLRHPLNARREVDALRLSWPEQVDNAQRRRHFRVPTAASTIPAVKLWTLTEPSACVAYERYNRRRHVEPAERRPATHEKPPWPGQKPRWRGLIVDVSGGGLCVALPREAEAIAREGTLLWAKLPLPVLEEPLYAAARVVRCEQQTKRVLRIGLAFQFKHNPGHERFITDRMCSYATHLQRLQLQRGRGR